MAIGERHLNLSNGSIAVASDPALYKQAKICVYTIMQCEFHENKCMHQKWCINSTSIPNFITILRDLEFLILSPDPLAECIEAVNLRFQG